MKREIKFKAWHKELGIMLTDMECEGNEELFKKIGCPYAKEIKVLHDCILRESAPDMGYYGGGYWDDLFTDQCEYLQYTGIKDKNGVEIFEGDMLANGSFIHWVVFFEEASFKVKFPNPINTSRYTLTRDAAEMREVIGNIYENPELLEEV